MKKNYSKNIKESLKIIGSAISGDRADQGILQSFAIGDSASLDRYLTESIATTDLLAAFSVATQEKVLSQYPDAPKVWTKIASRKRLPDFKEHKSREFMWDKGLLIDENAGARIVPGALARIPEGTEYPTFSFKTGETAVQLHKHGARLPFFWEAVINGEWEYLGSIPGRLLEFASQTEEVEAFTQIADVSGPRADVFPTVSTLPLNLENLSTAKTEVRSRKVNGRAVRVPRFALVVSPALEETARRLLAITSLEVTDVNGTYMTTTSNGDVELVVADVLVDIHTDSTTNNVDTTWYLVPTGGSDGTRDSITVNFLERHENPELRISGNTGNYLGGGAVPGLEGSLLNDDAEYRIRHVVTGAVAHNEAMFASNGSGVTP